MQKSIITFQGYICNSQFSHLSNWPIDGIVSGTIILSKCGWGSTYNELESRYSPKLHKKDPRIRIQFCVSFLLVYQGFTSLRIYIYLGTFVDFIAYQFLKIWFAVAQTQMKGNGLVMVWIAQIIVIIIYQERSGEEVLPALKPALTHQYNALMTT